MNRAMKRVGIGEGRERGKSGDKESRVEDQENGVAEMAGLCRQEKLEEGK